MRASIAALCLAIAACSAEPRSDGPPKLEPVAFDGASVQTAAAVNAHGERLTWVLGCRGCHGKELQGERFYESYASNLTRDLRTYSDADIGRALKEGQRPSGKPMWGMPSEIFQHLSDQDVAALISYLRTLPPAGPPTGPMLPFGAETKAQIAKGEFKPAADFVREEKALAPVDLGPQHALGRYISRVTCAECHAAELNGRDNSPDLIIAGGYSRPEFERLITQGIPTGGRTLKEMMQGVAKERFSKLTTHERDALYAYLKARAEQPQ